MAQNTENPQTSTGPNPPNDTQLDEWHKSLARERISDYRLVRVLEYIDAHLSDHLDLRALSREAGISQFHFAALFRKAVGRSPHQHILHLRLQAARSMLCHTDRSAFEIALTCGFRSASHFAAAFRRKFSQSPTEFRSSQQSHNKLGPRLSTNGWSVARYCRCDRPAPLVRTTTVVLNEYMKTMQAVQLDHFRKPMVLRDVLF